MHPKRSSGTKRLYRRASRAFTQSTPDLHNQARRHHNMQKRSAPSISRPLQPGEHGSQSAPVPAGPASKHDKTLDMALNHGDIIIMPRADIQKYWFSGRMAELGKVRGTGQSAQMPFGFGGRCWRRWPAQWTGKIFFFFFHFLASVAVWRRWPAQWSRNSLSR